MLEKKWVDRFMKLAEEVGSWSKDSTKVGCVITDEREVKSMGYNGPAPGSPMDDDSLLLLVNKNDFIIHAEDNALFRCGIINNGTLFVNKVPCNKCAKKIVNAKHVGTNICAVYCRPLNTESKWYHNQREAITTLLNNGIQVHFITL